MRYNNFMILVLCCSQVEARDLCLTKEKNIFSFETKYNKILSVCKGEDEKYLTYRFGKAGNIELQFPKELDQSSWKKFEFSGMRRGGGKANAGFGDYSLVFDTKNIGYTVFQEWSDENDTYSIGVIVSGKGKPVTINGLKSTQEGSLVLLEDNKQLPNEAEK